jgi:hypothetical protein
VLSARSWLFVNPSLIYCVPGKLVISYPTQLQPWAGKLSHALASNLDEHLWKLSCGQALLFGVHYADDVHHLFLKQLPFVSPTEMEGMHARISARVMLVEGMANLMVALLRKHKSSDEARSTTNRARMARALVASCLTLPDTTTGEGSDEKARMREKIGGALSHLLDHKQPTLLWHRIRNLGAIQLEEAICTLLPSHHPFRRRREAGNNNV